MFIKISQKSTIKIMQLGAYIPSAYFVGDLQTDRHVSGFCGTSDQHPAQGPQIDIYYGFPTKYKSYKKYLSVALSWCGCALCSVAVKSGIAPHMYGSHLWSPPIASLCSIRLGWWGTQRRCVHLTNHVACTKHSFLYDSYGDLSAILEFPWASNQTINWCLGMIPGLHTTDAVPKASVP